MPATSIPTGVITVLVYLSQGGSSSLTMHQILQFYVNPLHWGNSYNVFDGIFIVTATETYVFIWSIMPDAHDNVGTFDEKC